MFRSFSLCDGGAGREPVRVPERERILTCCRLLDPHLASGDGFEETRGSVLRRRRWGVCQGGCEASCREAAGVWHGWEHRPRARFMVAQTFCESGRRGKCSKDMSLEDMVFQGTVLGPVLWNVFFAGAKSPSGSPRVSRILCMPTTSMPGSLSLHPFRPTCSMSTWTLAKRLHTSGVMQIECFSTRARRASIS